MKAGFPALVLGFLALGVLGGIAFGGGVLYGRQSAPAAKAATAAAAPVAAGATGAGTPAAGGGRGGGGGNGGAGGGAFNPANFSAGAIDSINGSTVVIRTAAGITSNVLLTPATRVETTVQGASSDLKAGSVVCIQGTPNEAGVLTATTIDIAPTCATLTITGGGNTGSAGAGAAGGGARPSGSGTPGARASATATR